MSETLTADAPSTTAAPAAPATTTTNASPAWQPVGVPIFSNGPGVRMSLTFRAESDALKGVYAAGQQEARAAVERHALADLALRPEVLRLGRVREALTTADGELRVVADELADVEQRRAAVIADVPRDSVAQLRDLNATIATLTGQRDQLSAALDAARREMAGADQAAHSVAADAWAAAKRAAHRHLDADLDSATREAAALLTPILTRLRSITAGRAALATAAPPKAAALIARALAGTPEPVPVMPAAVTNGTEIDQP